MAGTDVVGRQTVEVELLGTESEGLELQGRLARIWSDAVTPALARTLARLGPAGGVLVVDRLEIDLGVLSWDGLERDLPALVAREVTRFLAVSGPSSGPESGSASGSEFGPLAGPLSGFSRPGSGNLRYRPDRDAVGEALAVFLRTGRLPWSYRVPAGRHLADEVLAAWTPAAGGAAVLGAGLRAELIAALCVEASRLRLIRQFPLSFRQMLLRLLSMAAADTMDSCLDIAGIGADTSDIGVGRQSSPGAPGAPAIAAGQLAEALWETVLSGLSAGVATVAPGELLAVAWRAVSASAPGHADLAIRLRPHLRRAERPGSPVAAVAVPKPSVVNLTHLEASFDDGAYVSNAGVVLLHPFLPRFFEALGVAEGERLLRPERALALLHHLATGEVRAPEYELTVAKVLCGVPAEEPVPMVELGEDEIAEADALLRAAIRHWTVLRGTEPGGLRGTFLTRPGVLRDRQLRVEAETFDILLDQLPWGISMIRLPWMRGLLLVEWR